MPITPRQHPGVEVRPARTTRSADTRDARDDATIIAWLQRIDTDVIKGATQVATPSPTSARATAPRGMDRLEQQLMTTGTALTSFTRALDFAKNATMHLGVWLHPSRIAGLFEGMRQGMRRLLGLASPEDVRHAHIAVSGAAKTLTEVTALRSDAQKSFRQLNRRANRAAGRFVRARAAFINSGAARGSARHRFMQKTLHDAKEARERANTAKKRVGTLDTAQRWATVALNVAKGDLAGTVASAGESILGTVGKGATAATGLAPTTLLALGAAAGVATAGVAAIGIGFAKLTPALEDARKALAEVSPSQAMIEAVAQARTIRRGQQVGEETAGTSFLMSNALQDLKDTIAPIGALLMTVGSLFVAAVAKLIDGVLRPFAATAQLLLTGLNQLLEYLGIITEPSSQFGTGKWLETIANDTMWRMADNDPRFGRPAVFRR